MVSVNALPKSEAGPGGRNGAEGELTTGIAAAHWISVFISLLEVVIVVSWACVVDFAFGLKGRVVANSLEAPGHAVINGYSSSSVVRSSIIVPVSAYIFLSVRSYNMAPIRPNACWWD